MKQRITPEQLQELTQEQREALREWWQPRFGDKYLYCSKEIGIVNEEEEELAKSNEVQNVVFPLLSIGQCIQLLAEKDLLQLQSIFTKICLGILPASDLINALFAAVKEVL